MYCLHYRIVDLIEQTRPLSR